MKLFILFPLLLIIAAGCNNNNDDKPVSTIVLADSSMISTACQNALFAVKTADEAMTRSACKETKDLAADFRQRNAAIQQQLTVVAGKQNLQLPLDIDEVQLRRWQELMKNKGWSFDIEYLKLVKLMNKEQTSTLKRISKRAADSNIREVAAGLLTKVYIEDDLNQKVANIFEMRSQKDSTLSATTFQ